MLRHQPFAAAAIMRNGLIGIALTGMLASPAFAQSDGGSPFTGPRIEALVGYDRLKPGSGYDQDFEGEGDGGSIDGFTYGVGVGFDFDLGGVVAGIEGEYSDSTAKQRSEGTIDGSDISGSLQVGRDLYIGGRIGFRAAPSTLVYAKGGYINTKVDVAAEFDGADFGAPGLAGFSTTAKTPGYRLGAGVEQMFGPNAFGKLEYRYSNYKDFDFGDEGITVDDDNIDIDRHQVVVGLGFRF